MKNLLKRKNVRHLSNYEQNVLLPVLMKGLEMKKGKTNAVTNSEIIKSLRKYGVRINKRSFLVLINHIRTNDLMEGLMATSYGYYITNSEQELINYELSLLSREVELRKVRMSMERQRRAMFAQIPQSQTQLF